MKCQSCLTNLVIDYRVSVIPGVTELASEQLTLLDINKINSAYNCNLNPPMCKDGTKYLGSNETSGFIDGRNVKEACR